MCWFPVGSNSMGISTKDFKFHVYSCSTIPGGLIKSWHFWIVCQLKTVKNFRKIFMNMYGWRSHLSYKTKNLKIVWVKGMKIRLRKSRLCVLAEWKAPQRGNCRWCDEIMINYDGYSFYCVWHDLFKPQKMNKWICMTSLITNGLLALPGVVLVMMSVLLILKVGGPGLKKLMSWLRHIFFGLQIFRHLYLIHVGVVLLHARPQRVTSKKKRGTQKVDGPLAHLAHAVPPPLVESGWVGGGKRWDTSSMAQTHIHNCHTLNKSGQCSPKHKLFSQFWCHMTDETFSYPYTYENFPKRFHIFIWQTIQKGQLFLDTRYRAVCV